MSALLLRARSDARSHLRSWLVLVMLTGVLSGALAAAGSGAIRTWTAYDRFAEATNAADVFVALPCGPADDGDNCDVYATALDGLSSVAALSVLHSLLIPVTDAEGKLLNQNEDPCFSEAGEMSVIATPGETLQAEVNRIQVVSGRLPAPSDPSAVIVSKPFADRTGTDVGDHLRLHLEAGHLCQGEEDESAAAGLGMGPATEVRVAAIGLMTAQVRSESGFYVESIHLTPALSQKATDAPWNTIAMVDLEKGTSTEEFHGEMAQAGVAGQIALVGDDLAFDVESGFTADITSLTLVALFGSISVVLVLGATLIRQANMATPDARTLWALGWTRRDLTRIGLIEGAVLGLLGSAICLLTAFLLSPLTPLGQARHVDPAGRYHLDPRIVVLALVGPWLLITVSYGIGLRRAAVRSARTEPRVRGQAWIDRLVTATPGLPVTISTGCRLATSSGRAREVVPIRTGTTGITLGLMGIVGAFTFIASLDHLVATPRLVGWNWDAGSFVEGVDDPEQLIADLQADPDVVAAGYGTFWPPTAGGPLQGPGGIAVWPMSFSTGPNAIRPTIITGRAPEGHDEVAVSTGLAYDLGLAAGDPLELVAPGPEGTELTALYEVVGTTVLPVGDGNIGGTVALTFDGIARIGTDVVPDMVFTDLTAGANWDDVAARTGLSDSMTREELAGKDQLQELVGISTDRTQQAPQLLAVLLGVMVVGVLSHLVVTTVSLRRHELAVLRALGCSGRQTRATVAWLVTIVASSTLLLAIPIGLFFGRQIWVENATFLHVLPETAVPWLGLLLLIPVTLLVANLVALIAGRRLTRLATVDNLHPE